MLAYIESTSDFPNIDLSINGFRAHSLSQCLVGVDTQNSPSTFAGVFTLEMGNVVAYVSAQGANPAVTQFRSLELDPSLATMQLKFTDLGGNRIIDDGSFTGTVERVNFGTTWNQTPGDVLRLGDDMYLACIADQSVVKVRVPANAKTCLMSIWDRELDRAYRGVAMILGSGRSVDYSPTQATNKTGITLQTAVPTGTSGPSGSLNITFRALGGGQGNNYLYLENRLGGEMRPIFKLTFIE